MFVSISPGGFRVFTGVETQEGEHGLLLLQGLRDGRKLQALGNIAGLGCIYIRAWLDKCESIIEHVWGLL